MATAFFFDVRIYWFCRGLHVTDSMRSSAPDADWRANPRWEGITRPYSGEDVDRLRGSLRVEHTIARLGAERLWELLHEENYVLGLGAVTGNQAIRSKERAA